MAEKPEADDWAERSDDEDCRPPKEGASEAYQLSPEVDAALAQARKRFEAAKRAP